MIRWTIFSTNYYAYKIEKNNTKYKWTNNNNPIYWNIFSVIYQTVMNNIIINCLKWRILLINLEKEISRANKYYKNLKDY